MTSRICSIRGDWNNILTTFSKRILKNFQYYILGYMLGRLFIWNCEERTWIQTTILASVHMVYTGWTLVTRKHCFQMGHGKTRYDFFQHNFCIVPYIPREPRRDPSNCRLYEHGIWYIYIGHCQVSNSQPVRSQVRTDSTRPQWRTFYLLNYSEIVSH